MKNGGNVVHVSIKIKVMEKKNIHNGYEYVDLGLPSGTLWATENITKKVIEVPHFSYDEVINSEKFASNFFGGKWKIPSKEQFEELFKNTERIWCEKKDNYSDCGMLFISKINGNKLFLSAKGYIDKEFKEYVDSVCTYWTSSINHNSDKIYRVRLSKGYESVDSIGDGFKYSIRAVVNKAELLRKDAREIADKVKRLKGDIAIFSDKYKLNKRNIINIIKILNNSES